MDKDVRPSPTDLLRTTPTIVHLDEGGDRTFSPHPASQVSAMLSMIEKASRTLSNAGETIEARDDAIRCFEAQLHDLKVQRDDAYAEAAATKAALGEVRTRVVAAERLARDACVEREQLREQLAASMMQIARLKRAIGSACATIDTAGQRSRPDKGLELSGTKAA